MSCLLLQADARRIPLVDGSVQCVVTSPPYWGLRDYGVEGQLGAEATPDEYVENLVEVFREVRRVLRDDGVAWLNLGDCYAANRSYQVTDSKHVDVGNTKGMRVPTGLKAKDLVGVPWRVFFALQADGWYTRADVVWHKPNPMPESLNGWRWERCRDCPGCEKCDPHDGLVLRRASWRPTRAHEFVFMLAKSSRYFCDAEASREPSVMRPQRRPRGHKRRRPGSDMPEHTWSGTARDEPAVDGNSAGRNRRDVWTITTRPYKGAHFATFPPDLVEPCLLAGTSSAGCCAECGAPWAPIVERKSLGVQGGVSRVPKDERGYADRQGQSQNDREGLAQSVSNVSGYYPTCDCDACETKPCVVLDPFAGSGTTLVVARRLGCDAVGTDLSRRYLTENARERLDKEV